MNPFVLITPENAGDYFTRILEIENLSFITPWSPMAFRDEVRNPLSQLWGYTSHGNLWGYICYWNSGREIQVMNLAVHPDCRRRGTGTFLMGRAIMAGVDEKAESVWLEVRTSNHVAQRLYEKLGFKEVGRRPRYYRDTGEDAIVMSLTDPYYPSTTTNRLREV
jgi:ribosomal-protein-alanine N-acetyltransferase